ncbi:tripartite tricarboxylate transporter substrate binding protein [Siccirubricoccus sp. G192]|uniref:Bug family tripartite tricarboxylate transporter substrate binding protein n=1 Tax=Siccirubricoccus sp. G192 TaxID=2849651 RepID=UPI001C2C3C35|nr:tripartite tricarboxylate transporter substrate binding protein [Siccirubricoccus sp. G192]MBV1797802.1 tripartite tricarboxylate transporter substrate binding protein [Siccirubricoccus sp. G192]
MPHASRRRLAAYLAGLAASPLLRATPALAQPAFPSRPVTIVVPFSPGGSTDVLTRLMAERMTEALGKPVQIENRPGGNTIIGAEAVARAQPDGHTILMAAGTTLTINPVIYRKLPYKMEDFAPITLASVFPFAVIARNDGPADIAAMIAAARARPGEITYGTNGPTTLTNVAMLMVLERLGLTMQDVTYRGDAAQLNDFIAGNLDLLVVAGSTALPVYNNQQGRILGWTSAERVPSTPDVPTFAEAAAPGLVAQSWFGLLAPARTPAAVVETLNAAAVRALQDPRIRERLTNDGQFVKGGTPEEFGTFLRDEAEKWRPILSRLDVPQN